MKTKVLISLHWLENFASKKKFNYFQFGGFFFILTSVKAFNKVSVVAFALFCQ